METLYIILLIKLLLIKHKLKININNYKVDLNNKRMKFIS
jgi:hypothetical protein